MAVWQAVWFKNTSQKIVTSVNNRKCAAFITRIHRSEIETYVFLIYVRLLHKSIGRTEKRNVRLSCERKVQDKDVLLCLERELADENLRLLLEPKVQGYKRYVWSNRLCCLSSAAKRIKGVVSEIT